MEYTEFLTNYKPYKKTLIYIRLRSLFFMSRNELSKDEMKCWVLKCKDELYREQITQYTTDPKKIAHKYLNKVLDKINEFRY